MYHMNSPSPSRTYRLDILLTFLKIFSHSHLNNNLCFFKHNFIYKLDIRVTFVKRHNRTYQNTNWRQPCTTWDPIPYLIISLLQFIKKTMFNAFSVILDYTLINDVPTNQLILRLIDFYWWDVTRWIGLNHIIHSWDKMPSISLSFNLAIVVPRRCI